MKRRIHTDYTNEELAELASRYSDIAQFKKEHRQPYFAIHRRGKFDEMCSHLERRIHTDYTDEEIKAVALKYKTRDEFHKQDGGAYLAAQRRGILDDVCSHMEELRHPKGDYSKEDCHAAALKYKTRMEFKRAEMYAYSRAFREGWLDDICEHMQPVGNWVKRKIYAFTFSDGYAYVGLSLNPERRRKDHVTPMEKKQSAVYQHIAETGATYEFTVLTDWLDIDVAGKVENDYIKKYKADGWKMLNRVKGGALGSIRRKK